MKPYRINLGLIFGHSYESNYATIRRCLTANPGIPLSTLKKYTNQLTEKLHGDFADRLRSLHPARPAIRYVEVSTHHHAYNTFSRQCPECALQLYHSDVYIFPWLTRCPIHHCEFTTTCPVCTLWWPKPQEMDKRECPGCGRVPMSALSSFERNVDYDAIGRIFNLLDDEPDGSVIDISTTYDLYRYRYRELGQWWDKVPPTSCYLASFRAFENASITADELNALHIKTLPVLQKRSRLKPVTNTVRWSKSPPPLADEFAVMKDIVCWISEHTDAAHQARIVNYRNVGSWLRLFDPNDLPELPELPSCPFCLALSLWFFHIAARRHDPYRARYINSYPFLGETTLFEFFEGWKPLVWLNDNEHPYSPDASFVSWFYQRGLKFFFAQLLRMAFCYLDEKNKIQAINRVIDIPEQPEELYEADFNGEWFTYRYINDNPLDRIIIGQTLKISRRCENQHHALAHSRMVRNQFAYEISPEYFTQIRFMELHEAFQKFLPLEITV